MTMHNTIQVVHYVNQFFGQYGGEDMASMGPVIKEGSVGPGKLLQNAFGDRGKVVATVICGDNYIAEKLEKVSYEIVDLVKAFAPDLLVAGPAFGSGRLGLACGAVCAAASKVLDIPSLTGMHDENAGVEVYRRDTYIVRTGPNTRSMAAAMEKIAELGLKLTTGTTLASPEEEGYFSRGYKRNVACARNAAERAVDMVLAKVRGTPFRTEVPLPQFDTVEAAPPITNLATAKIALVSDGGLVPKGNPDRIEYTNATKFAKYSISGVDDLLPGIYEVVHHGYNSAFVVADPDRLVPVDAARELEREGVIGKLYDYFLSTTGLITSMVNSKRIGQGMAAQLLQDGVQAVVLTST
jgi:glycine reductase